VKAKTKPVAPEAELRSWINRLDAKNQKLFKSVRAALRKRFPTAHELAYDYTSHIVVGYSPTENGIDSIVALAGREDGVQLYLHQGPRLPDPKKLLQGSAKQVRFLWVESARKLAHPDVKALIDAAVEHAGVPLAAKGQGALIIKSSAKKKSRKSAK
jgi:hypothetical protein